MTKKRILIIDDDTAIGDLEEVLRRAGYDTVRAYSGTEAILYLRDHRPDLILLDLMLPGLSGEEVLRQISAIPVIVVSAKAAAEDRVALLTGGAVDYLTKPFGMMEMVSRIRAVLRRAGPKSAPAVLRQGSILMDEGRHVVEVNGTQVTLTLKEYDLLRLLLENPGQVFSRDRLLSAVWGTDYYGETRTVDVHIGTLRTKLGAAGDILQTVRGVGYKLEAAHE